MFEVFNIFPFDGGSLVFVAILSIIIAILFFFFNKILSSFELSNSIKKNSELEDLLLSLEEVKQEDEEFAYKFNIIFKRYLKIIKSVFNSESLSNKDILKLYNNDKRFKEFLNLLEFNEFSSGHNRNEYFQVLKNALIKLLTNK